MATNTVSSLCRLTVMTERTRVDVAVPLGMTIADLMGTVVSGLGRDVADEGAAAGGFVLQRSGEPPLDQSLTLAASQVADGDVLHLRMRSAQLPEIAYDDVLDAVASGVLSRSVRWSAKQTERACIWAAAAAVVFVYVVSLTSGPDWIIPACLTGALAALLLGGAVVLERAYDKHGAALTSGTLSVVGGALCGAMAVGGDNAVWSFGSTQLLPAAAAAVLVAVLALVLLDRGVPGFVAVVGAGLMAAIGAAAADVGDFGGSATAAFTAGIALAVSPAIPMAAFKLSRLSLPPIPTGAADLQADHGRIDGARVLDQAARADQYMTGIVIALSTVVGAAAFVLSPGGVWERLLALVLGGICLIRARLFTGRAQRASMLIAAGVAALSAVWVAAARGDDTQRLLAVGVPVALVALVVLAMVVVLPGRKYAPTSGRAADIIEALLVLAVLPLALGIVGVYDRIREAVG